MGSSNGSSYVGINGDINNGEVSGHQGIGGIIGYNAGNCNGCFNKGTVEGEADYGQVIGKNSGAQTNNNYFLAGSSGESGGWAESRTEEEFESGQVCWEMSQQNTDWGQEIGEDPLPVPGKGDECPVYRVRFFSSHDGTEDKPDGAQTPLKTLYLNPGVEIEKPEDPKQEHMKFLFWSRYTDTPEEFDRWSEGYTAAEVNADWYSKPLKDFPFFAVYEVELEAQGDSDRPTVAYGQSLTIDLKDYVKFAVDGFDDDFSFKLASGSELPAGFIFDGTKVTVTAEASAGEYPLTFDVTDEMGPVYNTVSLAPAYENAQLTLTFIVSKVDATLDIEPSSKNLTYSGGEQELVVPGSGASGGTLVYALENVESAYSEEIPTAQDAGTYTVWYKVKDDENHNDTTPASVTSTIGKANATASVTGINAPYSGEDQQLVSGAATFGELQYSMSEEGAYSTVVPTAQDAGTYTVWYKVDGNDNYNGVTPTSVTATISKIDATVTVTGQTLTYSGEDQELVSGSATDGELQYSMSESGTYSPAVPTGRDADEYTVWYKVVGDRNHNDIGPRSVTAKIDKADATASVTGIDVTYTGDELALVSGSAVGGELRYSMSERGTYSTTVPKAKDADTYTVWYQVVGDNNHNDIAPTPVTAKIGKADATATVTGIDVTYTDEELALVSGTATGGELQYSMSKEGTYSTKVPTEKDAGEYTVWYKVVGDRNHNDIAPKSVMAKIGKADATATVTGIDVTYTGEELALVSGTAVGGELQYSMSERGTYSTTVPKAKDADTYTVWYKVVGDRNHNDTAPAPVTSTISKADATAKVTGIDVTYTGEERALISGTATFGELQYSMSEGGTYSTAVPAEKDAGEYTVWYKIEGNNNFNGIAPTPVTSKIGKAGATATVTGIDVTYNGEEQELVSGAATGGELQYSMSEDGTYSTAVPTEKDAGEYTVWYKVEGNNNYNGIAPTPVTARIGKAAATATVTGIDVTYNGEEQELVSGAATGGELQYSMSEDGTYSTTVPTAKEAGEYTVWYKVVGDKNHNGIEPTPVTARIQAVQSASVDTSSYYSVAVETVDHGTISPSHVYSDAGVTVTLTVKPDDGWSVGSVTVTRDSDGKAVEVTVNGGAYTFRMPSGAVTVKAEFICGRGDKCPLRQYRDVDLDAWYHDGIHYCVEHGLMSGIGNGLFDPEGTTTRAQLVEILYDLEGRPAVDLKTTYTDVPAGEWYAPAVRWATAAGISEGYGGGAFGPSDPVSREQLAAILYRYAEYKGLGVSERSDLHGFDDRGAVSAWASGAMGWASARGLITGISGRLVPSGASTRVQTATVLMRFCEDVTK